MRCCCLMCTHIWGIKLCKLSTCVLICLCGHAHDQNQLMWTVSFTHLCSEPYCEWLRHWATEWASDLYICWPVEQFSNLSAVLVGMILCVVGCVFICLGFQLWIVGHFGVVPVVRALDEFLDREWLHVVHLWHSGYHGRACISNLNSDQSHGAGTHGLWWCAQLTTLDVCVIAAISLVALVVNDWTCDHHAAVVQVWFVVVVVSK